MDPVFTGHPGKNGQFPPKPAGYAANINV